MVCAKYGFHWHLACICWVPTCLEGWRVSIGSTCPGARTIPSCSLSAPPVAHDDGYTGQVYGGDKKETMSSSTKTKIAFREPAIADGDAIYQLIRTSPPLDVNSRYAYLLLCHHFSETCVVAESDGEVVGFLSAYRPPRRPEVLFVWQVAVGETARGQGVAGRMLESVLARPACEHVSFLETTVSPSNAPSQRLFRSFAEKRQARSEETTLFPESAFGGDAHESEVLFRIGPF